MDQRTMGGNAGQDTDYPGWEEYYSQSKGKSAWGEEPPPFLAEHIIPHLPARSRVADLGSGDGRNSLPLVKAGLRVTSVDISSTALDKIAERFASCGSAAPTTVLGDLERLPFGPRQFDAAICIDALPQVLRPRRALEEIHRVLIPGGVFGLNVFTPEDCAFGEGRQEGPKAFVYKDALFRFFDHEDFFPLIEGLFDIIEHHHVSWIDPPHVPFRPYEHRHDALVYILKKPAQAIARPQR